MSGEGPIYHGATMRGAVDEAKELGPMAEAVDVFFDRLYSLLPVYVGRMASLKVGMAVGLAVLAVCLPLVREARLAGKAPGATPLEKQQWILFLVLASAAAVVVQSAVTDAHYRTAMVSANKQHLALVHWTKEYSRAMHPSIFLP